MLTERMAQEQAAQIRIDAEHDCPIYRLKKNIAEQKERIQKRFERG